MEDQSIYSEKKLGYFETTYKETLIAKPQDINVAITANHIFGLAFICNQIGTKEEDPEYGRFSCSYEEVTKVYINNNSRTSPIYIQCDENNKGVVNRHRIILPCFKNNEEIVRLITEAKAEDDKKRESLRDKEKSKKLREIQEQKFLEMEKRKRAADAEFETLTAGFGKPELPEAAKHLEQPHPPAEFEVSDMLGIDDIVGVVQEAPAKAAPVKEEPAPAPAPAPEPPRAPAPPAHEKRADAGNVVPMGRTAPAADKKPEVKDAVPMDRNAPAADKKPEVKAAAPAEEKKPETKPAAPAEEKKPEAKPAAPAEEKKPEAKPAAPEEIKAPEEAAQKKDEELPEVPEIRTPEVHKSREITIKPLVIPENPKFDEIEVPEIEDDENEIVEPAPGAKAATAVFDEIEVPVLDDEDIFIGEDDEKAGSAPAIDPKKIIDSVPEEKPSEKNADKAAEEPPKPFEPHDTMSLEEFQTAVMKLKEQLDKGQITHEHFAAEKAKLAKYLY